MSNQQIFLVLIVGLLWMAVSQDMGASNLRLYFIVKGISLRALIFWLNIAISVGMFIGALSSGPLADWIGRRKVIITYTIIHIASIILGGLSPNILVLIRL